MYQRFDQGFVGLIFSVFNTNTANQEQTVQLTAFQAVQGSAPQQQLEGTCSAELDGLDEQMRAALAASAAGGALQPPACVQGLLGVHQWLFTPRVCFLWPQLSSGCVLLL